VFGGSFTLHGLEVEPFCVRVIAVTLKRQKITLSHHRREDLLSYAIAELWVVSRKYDPGRYRDFRQFAGRSQPAQGRPLAQSRARTFDLALRQRLRLRARAVRLPRCRRRRRSTGAVYGLTRREVNKAIGRLKAEILAQGRQ
jgi:DNA-directed RNA polymerase specialized sigma subunit